ncbi:hypothetical protein [Nocardia sp. NPDC052112]|uniref:hypothetical protein n=1 Tax=Nocardia sp. NPDC052112 TaxID=3155646 RepID=UPI00344356BC
MKNFKGGGVDDMAADATETATTGDLDALLTALQGGDSSTSSATTTSSTTTKTGHYWTVQLVRPPGARAGLKSFIALAEAEIQTAVDLLGRGLTDPPPNVDDLMKPVIYESLGHSMTAEQYEAALTKVETKQTALITMDEKVMKTAIVVSAENDRTLRSIQTVVKDLNLKLEAVGSGKLKSAQEVALMKAIAAAVEDVYEKVTAVADSNAEMAGDSSDSDSGNDSSDGSSSSGDSGSGGLGSLVQGLMSMIPMAAMAAAPIAQELLKSHEDPNKDKDAPADGTQPQDGQAQAAAPGAAPAPGSPTPAPAATAPADPNAPGSTAPGSAAPAANSPMVPARASVRRSTTRPPAATSNEAETAAAVDAEGEVDETDSPVVQS